MPTFKPLLVACLCLFANVALGFNYPVLLTVDEVKILKHYIQRYSSSLSQGFRYNILGDSPSWWSDTVATNCPSRPKQFLAPRVTNIASDWMNSSIFYMEHLYKGQPVRGLPYMTSAKFSYFFIPIPLVTVTNQMILFLLSAFWGPPSPHPLWTSCMEAP